MTNHSRHYTRHEIAHARLWRRQMRQERWFEATVWALFAVAVGVIADLGIMASL